jgi:phosphohistidine phosphatase SixA
MIIYLARHGQTTGDIENRYGGDYDDHLTEVGRHQSEKLADQLQGKGIEKLFASPRIRAQETSAIVGKKLGLLVITLEAFRERNGYGTDPAVSFGNDNGTIKKVGAYYYMIGHGQLGCLKDSTLQKTFNSYSLDIRGENNEYEVELLN